MTISILNDESRAKPQPIEPEEVTETESDFRTGLKEYIPKRKTKPLSRRRRRSGLNAAKGRAKQYDTLSGRYYSNKSSAFKRGLEWNLTKEEASRLFKGKCYYCGGSDGELRGIDRVVNEEGYTSENCVSCCTTCNKMKGIVPFNTFVKKCADITWRHTILCG